jgi:hypothetical protein
MDLPAPDIDIITNEVHLNHYLRLQQQHLQEYQRSQPLPANREASFGAALIEQTHGTSLEVGTNKNCLLANPSQPDTKNYNT